MLAVLSGHDDQLVIAGKLWRNHIFRLSCGLACLVVDKTSRYLALRALGDIEAALLHEDVKRREVFFFEVHSRYWHVLVDYLREEVHIGRCIALDSLDKLSILLGPKRK